jgi:mRNA interferase HigB
MEIGVSGTGLLACLWANWSNPGDLRATFASVSFIGDLTVFNVGGNEYRIAALVHYRKQVVYIKRIGTHGDKWDL